MPHLEPTYLRYIYDGLIKGSIHPENAAELPEGLIGLYEEAFDERQPVYKRQQLLERFAIWALLKKEVSAKFVAEVLNQPEEEIQQFFATYSAWFNSPESGKYQLYHEQLKVYLLQKLSESEVHFLHEKLIARLEQAIKDQKADEFEWYGLEFLAIHVSLSAIILGDGQKLLNLAYSQSHWQRQLKISKGFTWTKNSLSSVMLWASKHNDEEVIECGLQMVDLYHQEQNAAPQIVALVAEGDFDSALKRIEQFGGNDKEGLQRKFILYMLCLMELSLLNFNSQSVRKLGIETLMSDFNRKLPINLELLDWGIFFNSKIVFQIYHECKKLGVETLEIFKHTKVIDLNFLLIESALSYLKDSVVQVINDLVIKNTSIIQKLLMFVSKSNKIEGYEKISHLVLDSNNIDFIRTDKTVYLIRNGEIKRAKIEFDLIEDLSNKYIVATEFKTYFLKIGNVKKFNDYEYYCLKIIENINSKSKKLRLNLVLVESLIIQEKASFAKILILEMIDELREIENDSEYCELLRKIIIILSKLNEIEYLEFCIGQLESFISDLWIDMLRDDECLKTVMFLTENNLSEYAIKFTNLMDNSILKFRANFLFENSEFEDSIESDLIRVAKDSACFEEKSMFLSSYVSELTLKNQELPKKIIAQFFKSDFYNEKIKKEILFDLGLMFINQNKIDKTNQIANNYFLDNIFDYHSYFALQEKIVVSHVKRKQFKLALELIRNTNDLSRLDLYHTFCNEILMNNNYILPEILKEAQDFAELKNSTIWQVKFKLLKNEINKFKMSDENLYAYILILSSNLEIKKKVSFFQDTIILLETKNKRELTKKINLNLYELVIQSLKHEDVFTDSQLSEIITFFLNWKQYDIAQKILNYVKDDFWIKTSNVNFLIEHLKDENINKALEILKLWENTNIHDKMISKICIRLFFMNQQELFQNYFNKINSSEIRLNCCREISFEIVSFAIEKKLYEKINFLNIDEFKQSFFRGICDSIKCIDLNQSVLIQMLKLLKNDYEHINIIFEKFYFSIVFFGSQNEINPNKLSEYFQNNWVPELKNNLFT